MTRTTWAICVLWFSFCPLAAQSVLAQDNRTDAESGKSEEEHTQATMSPLENLGGANQNMTPNRIVRIGDYVQAGLTESVDGIILVAGDATIQGRVAGDILVLKGNVHIREGAQIEGRVTTVMGEITGQENLIDPARRDGDFYTEINGWRLIPAGISVMMEGIPETAWGSRRVWFGWELMTFMTLTLVHIALVATFPQHMGAMAHTISHRPVGSTVLGLIVMAAIPYLSMLLIISIVGIPVMLLFSALLLAMAIYGKTAIFLSIGNTIFPQQSSVVATVVGYWIYRMAMVIPHINFITFTIAAVIGIGLCTRTLFGQKGPSSPKKSYRPQQYTRPRLR